MSKYLTGKTIIVTGGSKGIGFAAAKSLIEKGAKVAILARNQSSLDAAVAALGEERAYGLSVDVSDRQAVMDAFAQIQSHFGSIYGLVNNAGLSGSRRIEVVAEEELRKMVDLNFLGTVFCCQAAIPLMKQNGSGRIVNISSASVHHSNEFAHIGIYSATKAAVEQMSSFLREEVKEHSIGVTVLSPGATVTSVMDHFDPEAMVEAYEAWVGYSPKSDGTMEAESVGQAIAHCFEYPDGVAVDFIEVRPNVPTSKT